MAANENRSEKSTRAPDIRATRRNSWRMCICSTPPTPPPNTRRGFFCLLHFIFLLLPSFPNVRLFQFSSLFLSPSRRPTRRSTGPVFFRLVVASVSFPGGVMKGCDLLCAQLCMPAVSVCPSRVPAVRGCFEKIGYRTRRRRTSASCRKFTPRTRKPSRRAKSSG